MKTRISTILLFSAFTSFAIAEQATTTETGAAAPASPASTTAAPAAAPAPRTLVSINGQSITDADMLAFNALQGNKLQLNTEQGQLQAMNQLINTTLVAQVGMANNLQDNPQVAAAIQMATLQVLAEVQINKYLATNPISDEELKTAYDKQFSPEKLTEFKARHILLDEEQQAKDLIKSLDEGKDFAELAKENSKDASKSTGGDLGWIGRGQVVQPFGDAMAGQEKGKYSATPIKTQFGWHIILVEDSRPQQPPKFEEVKDQFSTQIQQQRLSDYITGLRNIAKIDVPGAKEKAAAATPTEKDAPAPAPAATENK